ncbi:DUF1828 domain-containing protein [Methylobacterium sp. WCS2018Hpa-22]|uniref:DUF1828 domain-containing protein n=1 Tax=Methylobacterium sp. WCS2018Hpa-22 TaxID=3073633 RepID=UPI00288A472C|nr:DUF1828 domain-containing protein [Methylobacterium sp. WCS2018Hpa-22]
MTTGVNIADRVRQAVENTARELVRTERIGESWYINLPLLYPDGSYVTVRVDPTPGGIRVSDDGFAYREAEDLEAPKGSFKRTASAIAEQMGVFVNNHAIFVDSSTDMLERAVHDVAEASWRVADRISQRLLSDDDEALSEALASRLLKVFGPNSVDPNKSTILGASTNEWTLSAVVRLPDRVAVFQAVSDHAASIYKASTAFRDLSELHDPPRLIAVVKDLSAFGPKLSLLVPSKVIQEQQSDSDFRRAAA